MKEQESEHLRTITMPNEQLLPFVIEELQATPGKTVTLPLRGNSMRPFLKDGRDQALLTQATSPHVGDAVLAFVDGQHYVLHRIVGIVEDRVTLRGDGNLATEHCRLTDVKAVALGFFRKGRTKMDSTSGLKWRVYSWLWCRLLPVRRYLLFALSPHWPQRLRKKTPQ